MNYLNPSGTSLTQRFHLKVPSFGFKKSIQFETGIKSFRSKMPIEFYAYLNRKEMCYIRLVKEDTQGTHLCLH